MVAAVLVPIILVLLGVLLAFLCVRRRAQANHRRAGSGAAFLPIEQEKRSWRSSAGSTGPQARTDGEAIGAPIVTSQRNNAYFTGLDTSSHTSRAGESVEYYTPERRSLGGTSAEPPPPYRGMGSNDAIPSIPPLPVMGAGFALSDRNEMSDEQRAHARSSMAEAYWPLAEPESPTALHALPHADLGLVPFPANERPSTSASQRSITSTLYSDSASVHDAQTARLSIGPTAAMSTASFTENPIPESSKAKPRIVSSGSGLGLRTSSDPFDDPKSPVSSLSSAGSSYRAPASRTGSFESGVSNVTP